MPRLADTLVEGTLGRWLKKVGDRIAQGEPLASIETDKVTTELTSSTAGTLLEVLVGEGQTVPVETPIARIGAAVAAEAAPSPPTSLQGLPKPTPLAARLLAEHGLEAAQIPARSTRLTKADVLTYVTATPATPDATLVPLTPMRRAIADHLVAAVRTIAHGQTVMAADLTELVAWREATRGSFQQQENANLTFTVLFVHALARQLAQHTGHAVDIGVAVALEAGLIVPVVRAAESLSLGATARALADLATRARLNKLAADETRGATMTVTNVGSFGSLSAAPIIPLGQIGILGPGLVEPRPMPTRDGGVRPGWRCLISLGFDRRAFDDFAADRFLRAVITTLTSLSPAV
jgi:2-oxoglutarate dehydrogenase E2 component (dihydrolipoamide succinyltransferase)